MVADPIWITPGDIIGVRVLPGIFGIKVQIRREALRIRFLAAGQSRLEHTGIGRWRRVRRDDMHDLAIYLDQHHQGP